MECDNRFYLYTGHRFLCTISSTSVTIKKSPLSNFRIVSEQGRTKDLKTQNWQLYKSPERASAVSTNIWGDQPSVMVRPPFPLSTSSCLCLHSAPQIHRSSASTRM